jgi:hypothetical protein
MLRLLLALLLFLGRLILFLLFWRFLWLIINILLSVLVCAKLSIRAWMSLWLLRFWLVILFGLCLMASRFSYNCELCCISTMVLLVSLLPWRIILNLISRIILRLILIYMSCQLVGLLAGLCRFTKFDYRLTICLGSPQIFMSWSIDLLILYCPVTSRSCSWSLKLFFPFILPRRQLFNMAPTFPDLFNRRLIRLNMGWW